LESVTISENPIDPAGLSNWYEITANLAGAAAAILGAILIWKNRKVDEDFSAVNQSTAQSSFTLLVNQLMKFSRDNDVNLSREQAIRIARSIVQDDREGMQPREILKDVLKTNFLTISQDKIDKVVAEVVGNSASAQATTPAPSGMTTEARYSLKRKLRELEEGLLNEFHGDMITSVGLSVAGLIGLGGTLWGWLKSNIGPYNGPNESIEEDHSTHNKQEFADRAIDLYCQQHGSITSEQEQAVVAFAETLYDEHATGADKDTAIDAAIDAVEHHETEVVKMVENNRIAMAKSRLAKKRKQAIQESISTLHRLARSKR
jgi:hypothetical protein